MKMNGTHQLTLANLDLSGISTDEQWRKVLEELDEFAAARNPEEQSEEGFDLFQAMHGLMLKLGINMEAANERHLQKMASADHERKRLGHV